MGMKSFLQCWANGGGYGGEPSRAEGGPGEEMPGDAPRVRVGGNTAVAGRSRRETRKNWTMEITIIGAGNAGGAIARGATRVGHRVTVTANDPDHARALAEEIGGTAAEDTADAVRGADLVVLAVPYGAVPDVAREIGDAVGGKTVVDATNPLKADGSGLAVTDRSGAEEAAAQLPGARIVKAFNTVLASRQADPVVDGTPLDGFYAGDDDQSKNTVRALLDAIGYRPIDAGPLTASRSLEHLAYLNISLNARGGWAWQSGWKLIGPMG